jgi:hypothetical protein
MQLVSQITSLLSRRETLLNRLADIIIRACDLQFPTLRPQFAILAGEVLASAHFS